MDVANVGLNCAGNENRVCGDSVIVSGKNNSVIGNSVQDKEMEPFLI
jgi:hypothetical protein